MEFIDYDNVGSYHEFCYFTSDKKYKNSVPKYTLNARKHDKLPDRYVVLSSHSDLFIIMETIDENDCKIYYGVIHDYFNIIEKGKPIYDDTLTFNSFAEFFEYLLEDEKKIIFDNCGMEVSHRLLRTN